MSNQTHLITREIGIDMGHRVTYHGSKCRNLHGHRYTIQATCEGPLFTEGEQEGMVLDFGFLKAEMMNIIDAYCDHGTCLWKDDPWIPKFLTHAQVINMQDDWKHKPEMHYKFFDESEFGKLYVIPYVPTAENLARHWYERLRPMILDRSNNQATLLKVKVWETPNCSAEYEAPIEPNPFKDLNDRLARLEVANAGY